MKILRLSLCLLGMIALLESCAAPQRTYHRRVILRHSHHPRGVPW